MLLRGNFPQCTDSYSSGLKALNGAGRSQAGFAAVLVAVCLLPGI